MTNFSAFFVRSAFFLPNAMASAIILYGQPLFVNSNLVHLQGFFQDFRQEGANVTILELRGGMYYCCIFQGFCHRGNVIAHS